MSSKTKKLIKTGFGTPLAFGSATLVAGHLPGAAGRVSTQALSGSTRMVGLTTKISTIGIGFNMLKKAFPTKISKKRRRLI
jgi:hypothetical protein